MRFFLFLVPVLGFGLFSFGLFGACSSNNGAADAGAPCSSDTDCPPPPSDSTAVLCMWPTTPSCGQPLGNCVVQPLSAGDGAATSTCLGPHICPCDGGAAQIATCYGAPWPVSGNLGCLDAPCTTSDDCNAGLACVAAACSAGVVADAGANDAGTQSDSAPPNDADAGPANDADAGGDVNAASDATSPTDAAPDDAG